MTTTPDAGSGRGTMVMRPVAILGAWAMGVAAILSACAEGGVGTAGNIDATSQTTELVETDVEAPEVFQLTEAGLWDGRPSLGGVWVAHPDVTDPERVIIRNEDTGSFVIGALFRRERENPGPALQVSSDAADALSMLAGAPASLNVTALRREEAAAPAQTEATVPVGIPADDAEPVAAVTASDVAATSTLAPSTVETSSLDAAAGPVDPSTVEAVAEATAAILASSGDAVAAPSGLAPASSDLERPFIQLGIFSIEANADATAAAMGAEGLPARVVASTTQGAAFWRVIVGPAATEAERDDLLENARAQGFADAYAVQS